MKRKIVVTTPEIRLSATISTNGLVLRRHEVERIRDELADRLQEAVAGLIYLKTPRHKVRVR